MKREENLMNIAVILLAGKGTRMNYGKRPKQFLDVNGKPLAIHTIQKFESNQKIDKIVLVTSQDYLDELKTLINQFNISKVLAIINGGETRQDSVYNALEYLKSKMIDEDDVILIHDGARVLVDNQIINDNIKNCNLYSAIATVIPSTDTIFNSIDKQTIGSIENRNELFLAQTPQTFKFKIIYNAHQIAKLSGNNQSTDDCSLVIKTGIKIHFVIGSKLNFKVTTFEDYLMLKSIMKMDS